MAKIDKKANWDEVTIIDNKVCIGGFEVLKAWTNPFLESKSGKGWLWLATKIETKKEGKPFIWYGYVKGFEDEWGTWYQTDTTLTGTTEVPLDELSSLLVQ